MRLLARVIRCGRKPGSSSLLLVGLLALGTTPGFSSSPSHERIQANYTQDGNVVGVTLIVYNYTTSADLQFLSLAFQEGQDRQLATALSKTKAVGLCSITGDSQLRRRVHPNGCNANRAGDHLYRQPSTSIR